LGIFWGGSFQYVYNDFLLWGLKGCLLFWSIIMGKVFMMFFFDGEFILCNFFDKIQGVLIILIGTFLYLIIMSLSMKKYLEIYYIEMGYLNWFFGDFFRKGGFKLLLLGDWDKIWFEIVGPKGVSKFLVSVSSRVSFYKKSMKIRLILLLFFILFMMILFFSLYLKRGFEETKNFNYS